MLKKKSLNKRIMTGIRYMIPLSIVAVCIMMEGQLNFMYIFANSMILYFASDLSEE